MSEKLTIFLLILAGLVVAIGVFAALFFIRAPYGRYYRKGWGPTLPSRISWLIMESPSVVVMAWCFFQGTAPKNLPLVIFLLMWEAHYIHRAWIYPFQIADSRKRWPVVVLGMGFLFNLGNSILNGRYLFTTSGGYPLVWIIDPRFIAGFSLFIAGFITNRWADRVLQRLRRPGETGYKIPYGGLYRWVTCPNYLGEIVEWSGWALATWSLPGLAFAIWTFANLAPRAQSNHAWYRQNFAEYPQERKALIPGLWWSYFFLLNSLTSPAEGN
jgi:3-oxo-5-alpha-steroid 4-dehydrogenase 1